MLLYKRQSAQDRMSDALLQDLALGRLGIAKVHHLVQQLVDDDKVVANAFLLQLFKVLFQHGSQLVEEEQDLCRIGIPSGQGQDCRCAEKGEQTDVRTTRSKTTSERTIEIVVSDEHVVDALAGKARAHCASAVLLFHVEQERQEALDLGQRNVIAIRSLDQRLALDVDDGHERGHDDCV